MKREKIWGLVILALIALAGIVVSNHPIRIGHTTIFGRHPVKYGLDIRGGVRAVLQADTSKMPNGATWNNATAEQVRNILENRINSSGVGEATVQYKAPDQYIIELPDVKNEDAILQQLGTTASMTFYYFKDVECQRDPNRPVKMSVNHDAKGHEVYSFFDKRTGQSFRDGAQIRADWTALLTDAAANPPDAGKPYMSPAGGLGADVPVTLTPDQQKKADDLNRELAAWNQFIAAQPVILHGADIEPKSTAQLGGQLGGDPTVSQVFTANGAKKFADFTREHTNELNGIVLDDAVIMAPNINEPILDGQAQISGGFANLAEAKALANLLNAGALPVPLKQVQADSVSASLGEGAVHQSIVAGLVGLVLVLLFMLFYYRLPGLIADVALLIYSLFTLAIFLGGLAWLGVPAVTMTLPGIAGFILSIGMAVDANILIFERLKEELRAGKSLRSAIDAGFKRAFTAIRDSNICTSITCIVLLSLGTPSVRGFALTLLIGVIVSLFSAITVTRTLLYLLVDAGIGNNPALFGLNVRNLRATDTSGGRAGINIIGRRKFFYGLSALIIVPGLVFLAMGGLKKSIEFTGGTQIHVKYTQPVTQEAVEKAIQGAGFVKPIPHVQMANSGRDAIVSVAQKSDKANRYQNPIYLRLTQALDTLAPHESDPRKFVLQFGTVGGVISAELTSRAIQAVIIASVLITLYLATVFAIGGFVAGLRLGASAVGALLHDVLVLLGAFAIFGYFLNWEIDSLFVTAMLTVIGFSVHDTVVIFDRVRENLKHKSRNEAFEPLVNRAVNQTLSRSLNTSFTVVMTLIALVVLGGHTTRLLNVALLIGIISGTYSSIFNAAAILVDWENWLARRQSRNGGGTALPLTSRGGDSPATNAGSGGSARPTPPRPAPKAPALTKTVSGSTTGTASTTNSPGISTIRPKKKKPARRF